MRFKLKYFENGKPEVCEGVLRSLPDWFGIEKSTQTYINISKELPMIVAYHNDEAVGFLSIKIHSEHSGEIYVMGVASRIHRQGVGKLLLEEAECRLKGEGVEFIQVKTVDSSRESDFYKKTRLFYQSLGFKKLEVFPTLWGEHNPCLLLVKSLK